MAEQPDTPVVRSPLSAQIENRLLVFGATSMIAGLTWLLAILLVVPQWPFGADGAAQLDGRTVVVLATTAVIILVGDVLPVLHGRGKVGIAVRWSVPFNMALLAYGGVIPMLVMELLGNLVINLGSRPRPAVLMGNLAASLLSVASMWTTLALFGWRADLTSPWSLSEILDVPALLLAVVLGEAASGAVFIVQMRILTGRPFRQLFAADVSFYLRQGGLHQLAMVPAVVVVMVHAPMLTVLMILTVTAVHRAQADQRRSAHAAEHDGLTGLANRRSFVSVVRRAVGAATSVRPVALLVLDLDRFKEINDQQGHPVGDQALEETARRLRAGARENDVVGRIGGDEFAVLLTDLTDTEEALSVARRLRQEVGRPFRVGDQDVELGASIGVAVAPDHGTDFDTLYARADAAMFDAKRDRGAPRLYAPPAQASSPGWARHSPCSAVGLG